jgi:hypothetical protein
MKQLTLLFSIMLISFNAFSEGDTTSIKRTWLLNILKDGHKSTNSNSPTTNFTLKPNTYEFISKFISEQQLYTKMLELFNCAELKAISEAKLVGYRNLNKFDSNTLEKVEQGLREVVAELLHYISAYPNAAFNDCAIRTTNNDQHIEARGKINLLRSFTIETFVAIVDHILFKQIPHIRDIKLGQAIHDFKLKYLSTRHKLNNPL